MGELVGVGYVVVGENIGEVGVQEIVYCYGIVFFGGDVQGFQVQVVGVGVVVYCYQYCVEWQVFFIVVGLCI